MIFLQDTKFYKELLKDVCVWNSQLISSFKYHPLSSSITPTKS